MQLHNLTVSVLFGSGSPSSDIQQMLDNSPELTVLDQTCDPEELIQAHSVLPPDMVLVEVNGANHIPEWLENLTRKHPQTPIVLCSHNRNPDFLIRAMQVGVREFLPLPLDAADLKAAMERIAVTKKRVRTLDNQKGFVIAVTGHKGGVGATTMAVNLAVALSETTMDNLALVDLGRPFPDVGNFLDQESSYSISDLIQNFESLDQSFLQRIMQPYGARMSILHGCSDFKEQDNIELDFLEKILALLRNHYRYVIIDLSHWLDDFFLKTITQADLVLMLTGLSVPDLRNLKKIWPMFLEWHQGPRKMKVVVNRYDRGNALQLRDVEHIIQSPVFDAIPSDYQTLTEGLNQGNPLSIVAPRSKIWKSVKQLAERVKQERASLFGETELAVAAEGPRRKFWPFS
jgi:pilus assembly protein CpaE